MRRDLPDFPWDSLAQAKKRASAHPDGIVDLSVGTPVDPTPDLAQRRLADSANSPGYPTVWGTPELRQVIVNYLVQRWYAPSMSEESVMPVVGTKEFVAWLPTLLGLGAESAIVIPTTAYPTYDVGAAMVGAATQRCDRPEDVNGNPDLIWINSPANPHGRILSRAELRAWVFFARETGAIIASDECYGEFGWDAEPASILDVAVSESNITNLLALHSISKRSNAAGYRGGFVAGDPELVQRLVAIRKHLGMIVPKPVQDAMAVLYSDQKHVEQQRERYLRRRFLLAPALRSAGFRIDYSEGSLYLWATRDEDCRATVDWFAERGILVAPGDFYGDGSSNHVRVALTATDERIQEACYRLS